MKNFKILKIRDNYDIDNSGIVKSNGRVTNPTTMQEGISTKLIKISLSWQMVNHENSF